MVPCKRRKHEVLDRTKSAIMLPQQYRHAIVREISSGEIEETVAIEVSRQDGGRKIANVKVLCHAEGATTQP
jgi:hypothetical protein